MKTPSSLVICNAKNSKNFLAQQITVCLIIPNQKNLFSLISINKPKSLYKSVICNTNMTLTSWRTTKIPEYYFNEIEKTISLSQRYVSVSEFIRQAIEEKLTNTKVNTNFLIIKDLIFTEERIKQIHEIISTQFEMDSKELLKENMQKIINQSLDVNLINFLSKFMQNFAKYHPFKDGNKRTLLIIIDAFLRLNNLKLKLNAKKDKETKDEIFFWQNSNQQKTPQQVKKFVNKHLENYSSTNDVDKEINMSIAENKLLLEKLSK